MRYKQLGRTGMFVPSMAQLDDNLAALGVQATPDDMARPDAASAPPAERPGWMFERQGAARTPKPFQPKAPQAEGAA